MKPRFLAFLAGLSLLAGACAPQTPATRIEANRGKYAPLSEHHKELVRQGQLERGMTGDAVFLAWGAPSRVYEGSDKGVQTARWDYAKLQPVCTTGFYGGFGWGGGYHGWRGGYPYGRCGYGSYYMVSPQVDYVPYRSATVQFRRGRVESWERTR